MAPEGSNDLRKYVENILLRVGGRLPHIGAIGNSLSVAKEIILNSDSFAVLTEVVVHDELRAGLLKATDMPISTAYWYRIRAIRR